MTVQVVVSYRANEREKGVIHSELGDISNIRYLADLKTHRRASALGKADVILSKSLAKAEIELEEAACLQNTRLIQLIFAGADKVPFAAIPENITVASNVGAFAIPLAEHVLAMVFCLAKSILPKHLQLSKGHFEQSGYNKELRGGICGIIGMGGNGAAIARLMKAVGMQVHGINRSATSSHPLDFIGGLVGYGRFIEKIRCACFDGPPDQTYAESHRASRATDHETGQHPYQCRPRQRGGTTGPV